MNRLRKTLFLLTLLGFAGTTFATATTTSTTKTAKHKKHYKKHKAKAKAATTGSVASIASKTSSDPIVADTNIPSNVPIDKIDMAAVANQPHLYSYSALAVDAKIGSIFKKQCRETLFFLA